MFGLSPVELVVIGLLGLMIFGPDKLPKLAADAARLLRELRRMASGAKRELGESLGSEFQDLGLQDLNPRTFVRKNLLDPIDEEPRNGATKRRSGEVEGAAKPDYDADTT